MNKLWNLQVLGVSERQAQ